MSDEQLRTRTRRLSVFAQRRPISMFLILVFGVGWPILAIPVLADRGLVSGRQVPVEFFALGVTWFVLLPAALWVTAVSDGRRAARTLLGRAFRWRLGAWWAVVLLALPVVTIVVGLVLGGSLAGGGVLSVVLRGGMSLIAAVLLIHLWEETVWAGFLQTRLERRHSLTVAALIAAVPFAAIHMPLLLIGETSGSGLLIGVAKLLALAVGMRLMVGVFLRATGSLLAVGLLHGVYNASNNAGGLIDGLLEGADQNLAAPIALVVVTALAAGYLHSRPRLSQLHSRRSNPQQPSSIPQGGTR
ncbi:MAG TPA: type II CAAX endopeptidase family protein [Propionibacteriaceae bacterium]